MKSIEIRPVKVLVVCLLLVSCQTPSHPPEPARDTASVPSTPSAMDQAINEIMLEANAAEGLAASYDLRLNHAIELLNGNSKAVYSTESELDCQLQENFAIIHASEERLHAMQDGVLTAGDRETYQRFIVHFVSGPLDTPVQIVSKSQLMRSLADHHAEVCEKTVCPQFPPASMTSGQLDPFDDEKMLGFQQTYLKRIATYGPDSLASTSKGKCFKSGDRMPNQVSSDNYDWATMHTGSAHLSNKQFSITYDDGPTSKYTPLIENMWLESGFKLPTFFWLNKNVRLRTPLAKKVLAEGFTIGSHSFDHADMGSLAKANSFDQLNKTDRQLFASEAAVARRGFAAWKKQKIEKEIGLATADTYRAVGIPRPNGNEYLFRLPYGSGVKNQLLGRTMKQYNIRHYFWTIDSLDWQDHNPNSVASRIEKEMRLRQGGIVLMHDIQPRTPRVTELLLTWLKGNPQIHIVQLPQKW